MNYTLKNWFFDIKLVNLAICLSITTIKQSTLLNYPVEFRECYFFILSGGVVFLMFLFSPLINLCHCINLYFLFRFEKCMNEFLSHCQKSTKHFSSQRHKSVSYSSSYRYKSMGYFSSYNSFCRYKLLDKKESRWALSSYLQVTDILT